MRGCYKLKPEGHYFLFFAIDFPFWAHSTQPATEITADAEKFIVHLSAILLMIEKSLVFDLIRGTSLWFWFVGINCRILLIEFFELMKKALEWLSRNSESETAVVQRHGALGFQLVWVLFWVYHALSMELEQMILN